MKTNNSILVATSLALFVISGCTLQKETSQSAVQAQVVDTGNPADKPGVAGVPGANVPTGPAMILRITNALEGNVNPANGNFNKAINQLDSGLPKLAHPLRAVGDENGSRLAHAACSDVSANTYGVNTGSTIALQKANIVAAGKRILSNCTGTLSATDANAAATINTEISSLVDQNGAAGDATDVTWISVCSTAVTVCTQMLGI